MTRSTYTASVSDKERHQCAQLEINLRSFSFHLLMICCCLVLLGQLFHPSRPYTPVAQHLGVIDQPDT